MTWPFIAVGLRPVARVVHGAITSLGRVDSEHTLPRNREDTLAAWFPISAQELDPFPVRPPEPYTTYGHSRHCGQKKYVQRERGRLSIANRMRIQSNAAKLSALPQDWARPLSAKPKSRTADPPAFSVAAW